MEKNWNKSKSVEQGKPMNSQVIREISQCNGYSCITEWASGYCMQMLINDRCKVLCASRHFLFCCMSLATRQPVTGHVCNGVCCECLTCSLQLSVWLWHAVSVLPVRRLWKARSWQQRDSEIAKINSWTVYCQGMRLCGHVLFQMNTYKAQNGCSTIWFAKCKYSVTCHCCQTTESYNWLLLPIL